MELNEYLQNYELKLTNLLMEKAQQYQLLGNNLLQSEDLANTWNKIAPHYLADAIPQIAEYPAVSFAWAAYVGMACAALWDQDWQFYSHIDNLYTYIRDKRGFDYMDEYICEEILKLSEQETKSIEDCLRSCAHTANDLIRKEELEPQSKLAFHAFARSTKAFFNIGAAIELKRKGYKYTKVDLN